MFSRPLPARLLGWLRRPHLARLLALVLTIAATLSGLATYVVLSGSLSLDADPKLVLGLLYLDLILLLLLGVVVFRRLAHLILARWKGSAGSRLHARLVALFSVVAVTPAIVVVVVIATVVVGIGSSSPPVHAGRRMPNAIAAPIAGIVRGARRTRRERRSAVGTPSR